MLTPAVFYGCESWTLKSTDEDRMKSFEMKAFRQILRVTWTSDWVLKKAGTEPFLLQSVKKRKLSYYGHVLRKEGSCIEKKIMQLHREKNNARCYFWSKKRKTKNTLAG